MNGHNRNCLPTHVNALFLKSSSKSSYHPTFVFGAVHNKRIVFKLHAWNMKYWIWNMHARTNRKTDILKQLINSKCGKHRHLKDGSTLKNNFQKTFLRLSINWSNRTEVIRDRSWNIQYKTPRLYHETTRLQHQVMNINIAYQTPARVHDHNIKIQNFQFNEADFMHFA